VKARLLVGARPLLGPSAVVLAGTSGARLLGLLFSIACAHFLIPADFGLLTYSLTIVTFCGILIQNAPTGLARYLSRHQESREEQETYFSNWLLVVLAMLALSLAFALPLGLAARLSGWMLVGLLVNLCGLAVFTTYNATQRGLQRFVEMAAYYILANFFELAFVLAAGLYGLRSPALYLVIYGLSYVPAALLMLRLRPLGLRFRLATLRLQLLRLIADFTWPQLLQTALFPDWSGCGIVLALPLLPSDAVGGYAAARPLIVAFGLAPGAVSAVLLPRVAALDGAGLRRTVSAALVLIGAIVVPGVLAIVLFGREVVMAVFGDRYLGGVDALSVLAVGSALYCFYVALESTMIGLGRPRIDALATGCAAVTSVVACAALIPQLGVVGAALGFAAGAGVQLAVISFYAVRLLGAHPDPALLQRAA